MVVNDLSTYLQEIYPQDAKRLETELQEFALGLKRYLPVFADNSWYKHIDLYVAYADSFKNEFKGLGKSKKPKSHNSDLFSRFQQPSHLQNFTSHLQYIKQLGFNSVHLLPFLSSPMIDKGFDVADYHEVRPELGSLDDLLELRDKAEKSGIKLFMDLVLNHISSAHEWFKQAEAGNEYFREYFFYAHKQPKFLRKVHKDSAVWAEYEVDGEKLLANIAFPEFAGDLPHWREGKDGHWYYHTYYPEQPDVNWFNPQVFIEFAKIALLWASRGFNFRLDAIPFVGKSPYKDAVGHDLNTHRIISALKYVVEQVNPECVFIIESYEQLDSIISYYGDTNLQQAQLAYNFFLCTNLWVSLVKHDVNFIWGRLAEMSEIPNHAVWINFLRNHDELSLAHLETGVQKQVANKLLEFGLPFREGFGVAGRTFSLLGENLARLKMAYLLLASFPGALSMPYGDELALKNNKLKRVGKHTDARNINRGQITNKSIESDTGEHVYHTIAGIMQARKQLRKYTNIWPERLHLPVNSKDDSCLFMAKYELGSSEMIILINLSDSKKLIEFDPAEYEKVAQINFAKLLEASVELGSYGGLWLQR